MAVVMMFLMVTVAAVLALVALDRLMPPALRWLAPLLPDDICGPGGWLRDTRNGTGIFDRRVPR